MPIEQHLVSVGIQFRRETLQELENELSDAQTRSDLVRQIVDDYLEQQKRKKVKGAKRKGAGALPQVQTEERARAVVHPVVDVREPATTTKGDRGSWVH